MVTISTSNTWEVSGDLVKLVLAILGVFLIYFFSFQLQTVLAKINRALSEKIGVFSTSKEYVIQRYVYQHSDSLIAKLYTWINNQIVALGLKRLGITVIGYLIFWAFIALLMSLLITLLANFGVVFFPVLYFMILVVVLVMTRVVVSERMEKREADIMNAVDLIVPEVHNGIKNAIVTYKDNFAPSVREDFQAFIVNIQDRGYTFEDAMFILSDNLGLVFKDFAQKAIYFEAVGEREMVEIFADIVETNRLRRQLRDENNNAFVSLKASFIVSVGLTFAYFMFLMFTDAFSREFFLINPVGKFLLMIMVGVVFGVLSYITTIKSKTI